MNVYLALNPLIISLFVRAKLLYTLSVFDLTMWISNVCATMEQASTIPIDRLYSDYQI